MAVAEKVGIDRRGNPVYKRRPDGEIILTTEYENQRISVHGVEQEIRVPRRVKAIDDDLPEIAKAYEAFRKKYPEPGLRAVISRIEAHNYRCFPKLAIDLDRYHVLAGANGAGKSTLLDIPVLIGDMLRRQSIVGTFLERQGTGKLARAMSVKIAKTPPSTSSATSCASGSRSS